MSLEVENLPQWFACQTSEGAKGSLNTCIRMYMIELGRKQNDT